uniref:Adenine phosphoribosyltransferase n=1 Tax=Panagrellus redivivus TaxID=6233 RepID=A0A7E4ZSG1_PANRE
MTDALKLRLKNVIKFVPDFPKAGICFWDIMPIFRDPKLVTDLCNAIAAHLKEANPGGVTAVAGLEARGFLFGPQVAVLLGVPFIPIRKKGKLPGKVVEERYQKEYGFDVIELQEDALTATDKVVIVDDLLATGGTLRAAVNLVRKTGASVAEAFVIVQLNKEDGSPLYSEDLSDINVVHWIN